MIAWHLDTEHDEPAEEGHFINSVVLPALAKTQTDNIPQVNKRLVRFSHPERGDIFLEFSCAAQRGHAGLQSMMPLAEQRIRMLRENSAQNSRWIAMNHRLRGSINVLNGPVQNLDHYLQKWGFEQLMSSFSDALQQIRSGDQVPPEAVYENMATIENELARNLETLRTTLYGNVAGLQRGIGRFNEFLKSYPTVLGLKDTNAELAVLAILADAVGELEHSLARSKRVRIDLCLPEIDRTRYTSKGCAYLLRESFFNLLQNAIMFCSKQEQTDRRTVTVDYTFRHNKELVISITDRGRGMLKEEIKRLNEEAERAVPAAINDLGLISGIRIAMRVAHRMNGTLRYYRPESGEGIVVEFVLPAKELFYESE